MIEVLPDGPAIDWAKSGGVPARRAVARWAWRLFRREWRQQTLVLILLSVTVAIAIGTMSAAYTMAPTPGDAEFGSASMFLEFEDPDPAAVEASIAVASEQLGTIDVIGLRDVLVPGQFRPVNLRMQDPQGPYSGPLLDLRNGNYPARPGEIAMTEGIAQLLQVDIGRQVSFDGASWTVVGIVETPSDLTDDFALAAPGAAQPTSAKILLDSSFEQVRSFRPPATSLGSSERATNENVIAAVTVLVVATVVLLLAALVASAS
ncbi:MAG: hypothetical protein L0Y54_17305, partial [Sporichthyaceae bacterium]|nr:hypothetical protein [Sporichthyaceae bacterium]